LLEVFVFVQLNMQEVTQQLHWRRLQEFIRFSRRAPFILARLYPKCNCK